MVRAWRAPRLTTRALQNRILVTAPEWVMRYGELRQREPRCSRARSPCRPAPPVRRSAGVDLTHPDPSSGYQTRLDPASSGFRPSYRGGITFPNTRFHDCKLSALRAAVALAEAREARALGASCTGLGLTPVHGWGAQSTKLRTQEEKAHVCPH